MRKSFCRLVWEKLAEFPSEKVEKSEKDRDLILGSVFSRTQ